MTVAEDQMVMFLQTMVRLIVTQPDDVRVHTEHVQSCMVMTVRVAKSDIGRVIGNRGHVANSIRSLTEAISRQAGIRCQINLPHGSGREQ